MNTVFYPTTLHSISRLKERKNIKNTRSAIKNIENALKKGKNADAFTSWERDYLINEAKADCSAIAYNNYCYIVNEYGCCVTMYKLPTWFGKKKHFDGKERIRNYKKYCKSHICNDWIS